ncbi:T-box transcription factor TBX22 [Lepisosteus oculatus]|uniref:T-box transcription factor TBX22 n=1 Tax=Lepisosteus oculatus TaxID=7918 RepID=UPI0003EA896A|nr:PREDICTED: T-box transcription factor TBX22 [Lepisosteus oculatus]
MQGLSSRAHAFSVEALVGKTPCKRIKAEDCKGERVAGSRADPGEQETTTAACTVIGEADELGKRRRVSSLLRKTAEAEKCGAGGARVELQGSDLWNRFHEIGTEMIITKAGRRMFPSVRVKVRNLDPFRQYYIAMDITPVDAKRYRYVYHSSQWMVAGNTDHSCITPRLYVHPDSPCSGETWMRQIISFDRVKLTNNEMDDKGHIILQSMHKYRPRVHVIEHDPRFDLSQIQSLPAQGVRTFSFPETEFTTVTAYQNQQITKLKIDRNPFAKGFRDPGRNRGVLDGILESYPWRGPLSLDFKPFALDPQNGSCRPPSSCGALSSPSCSPQSFPLGLPCSDTCLHSMALPLCYKMAPPAGVASPRPYSVPGADRLQEPPGVRSLSDFSLLPSLRGQKEPDCRGQCFQVSPPGVSALRLQGLPPPALRHAPPPCSLYSYSLPVPPHLASVTRHLKLASGVSLTPPDGLLSQTPWHPAINHCL